MYHEKTAALILALSNVFSFPVYAEEETEDEFAKGTRMNPYTEEGTNLGTLWNNENYVEDVVIKVDNAIPPETLSEMYPEFVEMGDERHLVFDVTIETGKGSNGDNELYCYLAIYFVTENLNESPAWIYNYSDPSIGGRWYIPTLKDLLSLNVAPKTPMMILM